MLGSKILGELGTTLAATSNRRTLQRNTCYFCSLDEGGAKFLRNVGSYKSHTALDPRRRHSTWLAVVVKCV
jgi:hypothetical protein